MQHVEALRAARQFPHHARGVHQSLNQFGLHVPPPKEVVVLRPIPPDNDAMPHEPVIRSLCLSRLRAAAVVALWWL
ncbi:hypothetical protein, partial [Xanthomonas citri]|uniref:hypothetical protein n=1 Tax=Xanthomonas citri TaxID=346 RepID=UPI001F2340D9